ncbi:MAG TPA: hypothetical protein VFS92_03355 [Planctomycetota bacterium]|nr:hypothetical protein [Planctomycetota bacterium]
MSGGEEEPARGRPRGPWAWSARRVLVGAAGGALAASPFAWYLEPSLLLWGAALGAATGAFVRLPVLPFRVLPGILVGPLAGGAAGGLLGWLYGKSNFDDEMRALATALAAMIGAVSGIVIGAVLGPVLDRIGPRPPDESPPA